MQLEFKDIKFKLGEIVFLKTDIEQSERIITGINIRENSITYALSQSINESWHYSFEITREIDIIKKTV
jgi:hypothetical protein